MSIARVRAPNTCGPRTCIIQLFRIPRFRVIVVNTDILNTSRRAQIHRKIRKTGYDDGENGLNVQQGQPSIGRKD